MELDDFFGNKQQYRNNYRGHTYQDSPSNAQNFRHTYQKYDSNYRMAHFLENLKTNRKLKRIVAIAFILIVAIIIALIVVLLPLILKLLNYISQNGVQGILNYVTGFLDQLWKGSGK